MLRICTKHTAIWAGLTLKASDKKK